MWNYKSFSYDYFSPPTLTHTFRCQLLEIYLQYTHIHVWEKSIWPQHLKCKVRLLNILVPEKNSLVRSFWKKCGYTLLMFKQVWTKITTSKFKISFFFNQIHQMYLLQSTIFSVCVFENKMFMYIRPIFIYKYKNFVMWSW